MTQELAQLNQRLAQLERQNRRFKVAGLGLAGALGLLTLPITLAASAPKTMVCDTVSAERFVIHDSRGRTRMLMDAYNTEPNIQLRNTKGKTVATLGVDQKGEAYLTFFDATGNVRGAKKASSESCAPSKCTSEKKDDGTIASR
jgi:hypothetical protein